MDTTWCVRPVEGIEQAVVMAGVGHLHAMALGQHGCPGEEEEWPGEGLYGRLLG